MNQAPNLELKTYFPKFNFEEEVDFDHHTFKSGEETSWLYIT